MKKILLSVFLLLLSGCASHLPKEVDIPITTKQPAPTIPKKPELPIAKLNKQSKPNEVIKAYAASVEMLEGYSDQLIKILKAYE